jgi:hypothetical protein
VFGAVSRRPTIVFNEDAVNISGHRMSLAGERNSDKVMAMEVWTDEKIENENEENSA